MVYILLPLVVFRVYDSDNNNYLDQQVIFIYLFRQFRPLLSMWSHVRPLSPIAPTTLHHKTMKVNDILI